MRSSVMALLMCFPLALAAGNGGQPQTPDRRPVVARPKATAPKPKVRTTKPKAPGQVKSPQALRPQPKMINERNR